MLFAPDCRRTAAAEGRGAGRARTPVGFPLQIPALRTRLQTHRGGRAGAAGAALPVQRVKLGHRDNGVAAGTAWHWWTGHIILAVTSQARPQAAFGEAAVVQWKEAGLLRPSVLKPVVATIERGLVLRKLGRLAEEDRAALRKVLGEILGS